MTKRRSLSDKSTRVLGLIATGHSYDQIVNGERDVTYPDIFLAAEEALRLGSAADFADSVAQIKAKYPNAYERWTPDDDDALAEMHRTGASVKAMADRFQRQPSAIRSRLTKLNPQ